jgi:pimeloyl-ACP methyl ester carboxylesterase
MNALPESILKVAPFTPGTDGVPPHSKQVFSLPSQRDSITRLIRTVENGVARRIVLIGHDLGGALVVPLQEALGEAVRCSVYINSLSMQLFYKRFKRIRQAVRSFYILLFQIPLVNRRTLAPFSKTFLRTIYNLGQLPKEDDLRNASSDVLWGIEVYRRCRRDMFRQIGRPITKGAVPTLFLHGVHDPYIITPTPDELEGAFESFELVTLDAGHWPQRVLVDEVSRRIMEFVSREAGGGAQA